MKKILSLLVLMIPLFVIGQPRNGPYPKQLPVIALTAPPSGSDFAPTLQQAIDSLLRVTNINTGVGGGKITLGPGFYVLSTNIAIPSEWPFSLELEGAFLATRIRCQGSTNEAQFYCTTNYTRFPLTNALSLWVHGIQFESEALYATNFIWRVDGQNWAEFDHNVFISSYVLTNGNGQLTKNFEGNMPDAPCGLGGIAVNYFYATSANANFYAHNNWFYGMAVAIANGAVISQINDNNFSCISVFQPNPLGLTPSAYATNLWRGGALHKGFLSAGAALVLLPNAGNSTLVRDNEFFACGAVAFVDPNAVSADPVRFINNRTSVTKWKILARDQGAELNSWYWESVYPSSGDSTPGVPTDSIVTNSAVVWQPNGSSAFANIGPLTHIVRPGLAPGVDVDPYFMWLGGRMIGDGLGLTNLPTPLVTNFTAYASGTAYTLTGTSAALDFGTTDPVLTINQTGTYKISGKVGVKYVGATYAGAQTVTFKFRRTNNTAADLTSGSRAVELPVLTTFTGGDVMDLPDIVYTATSGDTITIFGILSATPAAGSVTTDSADLMAIRLY